MQVWCEIEEAELENDNGNMIEGVIVTCPRCEHQTESFGRSEASIRRCLALLREECPLGENNFYDAPGDQLTES